MLRLLLSKEIVFFSLFLVGNPKGQRQMGFARTGVVYLAASLAIRRNVPLTERIKAALPVRKQGAKKACYCPPKVAGS